MAKFILAGEIVDTDAERGTVEDVTPGQINSWLKSLPEGEAVELEINSPGGSTSAGLAICNLLKQSGRQTTAHIIGLAASMASAIACACDKLMMDSNALMMIHNPWAFSEGDAEEMRKTADILDNYRDALISLYRGKFPGVSDAVLIQMMDDETWILGEHAKEFGLDAEIIPVEGTYRVAASLRNRFKNLPKDFIMEEKINAETVTVEKETVTETVE